MSKNKSDKTAPRDPAQNSEPADTESVDTESVDAEPVDAEPEKSGSGESGESGWAKGGLAALGERNAELQDQVLRMAAEMENLRRRTERDKADTAKYAISSFARDVLTIGDNIARAIEHVPEEAAEKDPALKSFLEGVRVTERELLIVMERHGIARLDPKGEKFDPNMHQAMFEAENKDVAEGTIVEVVQAGYVIAGRVLRPALVGVARGGEKPARAEPAPAPAEALKAAVDASAKPEAAAKPAAEGAAKRGRSKGKKKLGGKLDKSA